MKLPSKSLEKKLFKSGYGLIYGIDEVGLGPLAGPVVACAVAFRKKFFNRRYEKLNGLRDSKLLSAHQREEYAKQLMSETNIKFQVSYVYPKTIDRLNVYRASRIAMRRAIKKLYQVSTVKYHGEDSKNHNTKSVVLVDGPSKIAGLNLDQIPVIRGDRKVFAISCASIIAKVYRDNMMIRYAKKYPGYGFEKHKGYGTKLHRAMLVANGVSDIHRRSFMPISAIIQNSKIEIQNNNSKS